MTVFLGFRSYNLNLGIFTNLLKCKILFVKQNILENPDDLSSPRDSSFFFSSGQTEM